MVIKAPKRTVWFLGDSLDYDMILPKAGVVLGAQLALMLKDGKYYIRDMSSVSYSKTTCFQFVKGTS